MTPKLYIALGLLFVLIASNALVGYKAYNIGGDVIQGKWDKAEKDRLTAEAEANDKILKQRPRVKHENQNRNLDDLKRHVCKRGWVRNPDQCIAYR